MTLLGYSHSLILPNLFQGAAPPEGPVLAENGFKALVLCAVEHQPSPALFPGLVVIHAPFDDSGFRFTENEKVTAMRAARRVAHFVHRGQKTLVTCAMGINRSGVVTALAVHLLTGRPGDRCVDLVRTRRPIALQNPMFVEHLRGFRARPAMTDVSRG